MRYKIELEIGRRFGRLVVLERAPNLGILLNKGAYLCKCDCGVVKPIITTQLTNGHTQSCGCLGQENQEGFISAKTAGLNQVFCSYKNDARRANRVFDLDIEDFEYLTSQPCAYCGKEPSSFCKSARASGGGYKYNGLDRIDTKFGYTIDNVYPCCEFCNKMKMDHSVDAFFQQCKRIVEKQKSMG